MLAEPRTRHILWLIENHPEAEVFRIAPDVTTFEAAWHRLNNAADRDKARMNFIDAHVAKSNARHAGPKRDLTAIRGR